MEDQTCEEGRSRTKKTPRLLIWTPWGLKGDGNGGREASKEGVLGGGGRVPTFPSDHQWGLDMLSFRCRGILRRGVENGIPELELKSKLELEVAHG